MPSRRKAQRASLPAPSSAPSTGPGSTPGSVRRRLSAKRLSRPTLSPSRRDDGYAFFPDPADGPALAPDDFAEGLAEEFLMSATAGDWGQTAEEMYDEENGGPFIISSERTELARAKAEAEDFEREAFPTSSANPSVAPADEELEEEED